MVSFALVACWLFAVTVVSDFLTFSSGSTTGSVQVFSKTSLQSAVSASSTEFFRSGISDGHWRYTCLYGKFYSSSQLS